MRALSRRALLAGAAAMTTAAFPRPTRAAAGAPLTPRRALAAATLDGWVYAVGGWNGAVTQLATVERRPVGGGAAIGWETASPLMIARSQHGAAAWGGALWTLAGWSATDGLVRAVERWAPGDARWEIVAHLPTPRREPGVALYGGEIVVAGGFYGVNEADRDGFADDVEAFDPQTGRWRMLAPLTAARRGLALIAGADALYAVGGYAGPDGYLSLLERYDAARERWVVEPTRLAARTWAAGTTAADGALLVLGGFGARGFVAEVERYVPATGALTCVAPLAVGRAWLAAAPAPGGVLAMGGEEAGGIGGRVEFVAAGEGAA